MNVVRIAYQQILCRKQGAFRVNDRALNEFRCRIWWWFERCVWYEPRTRSHNLQGSWALVSSVSLSFPCASSPSTPDQASLLPPPCHSHPSYHPLATRIPLTTSSPLAYISNELSREFFSKHEHSNSSPYYESM